MILTNTNNYKCVDDLPLVMSVEVVAAVLGIGKNTAYDLVRAEKIKTVKVGRQYRIPKDALLEHINS